jgi:hypothetical protein
VFLHGTLLEKVYAQQPASFVSPSHPDHVCLLNKSLYGLKQVPHTWFLIFTAFLSKICFRGSKSDTSLFVLHHSSSQAILLLYVDDSILTANSTTLLNTIINKPHHEFDMTNLGPLRHFLGISVAQNSNGMFLSQEQYTTELLNHANMANCNPCLTPAATNSKPSITDGKPMTNPTKYHSITGALQYLIITRPDISFAVQQACLFMHAPTDIHFNLLKRILRYIKRTVGYGLHL